MMTSVSGSVWGNGDNLVATGQAQYLTDEEISRFLDDLDHDGDGMIDYDEVERKLDAVHDELIPQPRAHNILARKTSQLMRKISNLSRLHSHAQTPPNASPHHGTHLNVVPISEERELQHEEYGENLSVSTTQATSVTGRGGAVSRAQSQKTHRSHGNNQHRHEFLRSIIGSDARRIPRDEFAKRVKEWNIPSLELSGLESNRDYVRKMSPFRRIRAHWAVHGPEIAFLMLVVGLQIAFGVWQLAKYTRLEYVDAFGWGVGMAKLCAGALYPTMFFLIISMSRYVSTLLRRSYHLSRFINWDLSQSFHIKISCVALFLSTLHTIGHLSGTFRVGSEESREPKVALLLGADDTPVLYGHYIVSVPGLTGLTALGLFYVLALLSMPHVRRWNYELFQMGHLLMYPIVALMCAHGTSGLLQFPMMGYWLAIPTFFVLVERLFRLALGFHNIDATVQILDGETVEVTVMIPERRFWNYRPGQYILFQVPKISRFQWHPFTVSVCVGKKMQLHIKTDGDWTGQLRELADESGQPTRIVVGINGPFGAPAQKFYDYDHAIVVGSGIGVTPFSGILSDLQARDDAFHGRPGPPLHPINSWTGSYSERLPPVEEDEKTSDQNQKASRTTQTAQAQSNLYKESLRRGSKSVSRLTPEYRRVDFHWTVRERNYLLWISDLLNSVFTSQQWHRQRKLDEQESRQLSRTPGGGLCGMHRMPSTSSSSLVPHRTRSSRQSSTYIPPPSLPSTRAAAVLLPRLSTTTPVIMSKEDNVSSPLSPQSSISSISPIEPPQQGSSTALEDFDTLPNLDIRIHTHVTGILSKSRSIATHVYAWLLEMHRTPSHPASPLTGLLNPTQFGRPDFVTILDNHYEDMVRLRARDSRRKEVERERKERERAQKAREKEQRREREKEERAARKREREYGRAAYGKNNASASSIFSGLTFGGLSLGRGDRKASNVGIEGDSVGGHGNNKRHSFLGGGGRSTRHSNSDMTLCSTGRADSLYVYSSAAPTLAGKPSSTDGGGGGGGGSTSGPPEQLESKNSRPSQQREAGEETKRKLTRRTETPAAQTVNSSRNHSRTLSIGGGSSTQDTIRVGVFYCGTPAVGAILADRCRALTARGHAEGTGIEYHFVAEVFG